LPDYSPFPFYPSSIHTGTRLADWLPLGRTEGRVTAPQRLTCSRSSDPPYPDLGLAPFSPGWEAPPAHHDCSSLHFFYLLPAVAATRLRSKLSPKMFPLFPFEWELWSAPPSTRHHLFLEPILFLHIMSLVSRISFCDRLFQIGHCFHVS